MAELKTKKTTQNPKEFLDTVEPEEKRKDSYVLLEMMQKITGEKAAMWGTSIVGFGMYHYKSERSSQEGDWPLIGFSPRKQNLTLYIMPGHGDNEELLKKLGKHTKTGGCLYIKRLSDVDQKVLAALIENGLRYMKKNLDIMAHTIAYIALLRGINVGGKNIIKMADLKSCFEEMGFTDVSTYIQSGNVLFTSPERDPKHLMHTIEAALSKKFGYAIRVVAVSHAQLKEAVTSAPRGFGTKPDIYRYDVMFLKEPLTAAEVLKSIPIKEGVDEIHAGRDVVYFSRLIKKATQSKLSRVVALPIYKYMTIRNWNTTTKLLALLEK